MPYVRIGRSIVTYCFQNLLEKKKLPLSVSFLENLPSDKINMNCPKVALIAGASRGVGAAVARSLAAHSNVRIMINYHQNQDAAKQLISEMEYLRTQSSHNVKNSPSPMFAAAQGDITNRAEMTRLVQQTVEQMGRLDIVISNVGWTRMTDFMNIEDADNEEDWDRCFDVNVKSHFHLFRACQAHLESSEGTFIATASVAGVKPSGSSLVRFVFVDTRLIF